jgi:hypothetical protein
MTGPLGGFVIALPACGCSGNLLSSPDEAKHVLIQTSSDRRRQAFLSATAGILFLVVAIFGRSWDWRGVLSFSAGVLWLIISVQQFRKAKPGEPRSPE